MFRLFSRGASFTVFGVCISENSDMIMVLFSGPSRCYAKAEVAVAVLRYRAKSVSIRCAFVRLCVKHFCPRRNL